MFPIEIPPEYDSIGLILGLLTIFLAMPSIILSVSIYLTSEKSSRFEMRLSRLLFYFFLFVAILDFIFILVISEK